MRKQRHELADAEQCPMEAALDLIGGKWKGVILFRLSMRTYRFNELNREICSISPRSLTKQLRELEADGLIDRKIYPVVPPKVEYSLNKKGRSLVPILTLLKNWGETYALPALAREERARTE